MAVDFEELEGSPHVSYDDSQGFSAVREFLVSWSDWQAFILELYGLYQVTGTSGGGQFIQGPASFPGIIDAYPTSFNVEPMDPSSPLPQEGMTVTNFYNNYDQAKITVQYKTVMSNSGDRKNQPEVPGGWVTFECDGGMEVLTIPGRFWKWPDGSTVTEDMSPGLKIPTENFSLTWHRCVTPPWDAIRDARGCINQYQFLNHAPGTVLFVSDKSDRSFQFGDTNLWTITYNFEAKEVKKMTGSPPVLTTYGFNYIYRPGFGYQAPNDGLSPPNGIFVPADFAPLFSYGTD